MEDADWGHPLLKDCLFSDLTLPEITRSQYLFDDVDDISRMDPSVFGGPGPEDMKPSLGDRLPPISNCFDPIRRAFADLDSIHGPPNLCRHESLMDSLNEDLRVKSEPSSLDGDSCSRDEIFSEDSYCPQTDDYSQNIGVLGSPLPGGSAHTSVITLGHQGNGVHREKEPSQSNGIVVTAGYSANNLGVNGIGNRYSHPTTTGAVYSNSSTSNGVGPPNRPRLLIATLPSNNMTVIKRRHLEECSPSPPSSNGSSPSDSLGSGPCFGPLRNRSKMHELAIKSRLITEQDPRGNGCVLLSPEEKRTLIQEGYSVPSKLPLSKCDEEALKVVRRKIKNKLSAQESRRKRKEYMETLEQKVQNFHSENASLRQRLRQLEQSNRSLSGQLRKLQTMVGASVGNVSIATQTGVCLTAFVLLFAVFVPAFPSMLPSQISLWRSWDGTVEPDMLFPADFFTQPLNPSRVLLASKDKDNCDIPYSARYFDPAETNSNRDPGRHGDLSEKMAADLESEESSDYENDEARMQQKELLFTAGVVEENNNVQALGKPETSYEQQNLSVLAVEPKQNGLSSKNGGLLNGCDLGGCTARSKA